MKVQDAAFVPISNMLLWKSRKFSASI